MEYRKENKYIITKKDYIILKNRLDNIMKLDSHIKNDDSYNIKSVYFDNYDNQFFYENEAGVNERLKIRIRIYDNSFDIINLEIKYKNNNLTKKESCKISKELCEKLISGKRLSFSECDHNKVLNKIYLEQNMHLLKPKIIVEYDRVAYIDRIGNVRITIDKNIRTSKNVNRFFDSNIWATPILEKDLYVLEVKYDELLPDYIANIIEINNLNQTAFSKYYLSRNMLMEG